MLDIKELARAIEDITELAVLSVLRQLRPELDEVKQAEAYRIAGSRLWVDRHVKAGNLKGYKRGKAVNSPIFYSRFEIAALKKAEKCLKQN